VDIAAGGSGSSALIVSGAPDAEPPACVGEAVVGSGDASHDDTPGSESWADTPTEVVGGAGESPWGQFHQKELRAPLYAMTTIPARLHALGYHC